MNKKVVFIGSRFNVLAKLLEMNLDVTIFSLEHCVLEKELLERKIKYVPFSIKEKKEVIERLKKESFDILVSNGCPFILPVDEFSKNQLFFNLHPTYLPLLQGKTPMNGVFYDEHTFYGATMHIMDAGIDTGNIIYQEKYTLTEDIDLGLLYYLSMSLEGDVFAHGWKILESSNFLYKGKPQEGESTYFNRTEEHRNIDFLNMFTSEILKKIRSFSLSTQGALGTIENSRYKIFEASEIKNEIILKKFSHAKAGDIVLRYDDKLLVKTVDGIIKIEKSLKI